MVSMILDPITPLLATYELIRWIAFDRSPNDQNMFGLATYIPCFPFSFILSTKLIQSYTVPESLKLLLLVNNEKDGRSVCACMEMEGAEQASAVPSFWYRLVLLSALRLDFGKFKDSRLLILLTPFSGVKHSTRTGGDAL
jgi:hypothetical protein